MNSKKLKKMHKKEYEDFFTKNNLVVSSPLLLNWSGDIFNNYKGIRIKQKLPLRIYLGINKIKEKEIRFNTINYLDINEDAYIESDLKEYAPFFSKFSDYFNKIFSEQVSKQGGIEINILSEISRGTGLGFISIAGLLLQIGLEKNYNNTNYINSDNIEINDFLNTNTSLDKLFRSSMELNKELGNKLSVENQISSFFDSYYPIVSFKEDTGVDFENIDISSVKMYGYRLNNLEKELSSVPFIPIDYGLIYSGRPVLVDQIVSTNDDTFKWTGEIKSKLKGYFGDNLDATLPIRKPKLYELGTLCRKFS